MLRWFIRRRRSPIPVLTGPDVEQLRRYFGDMPNDVTATPQRHRTVPLSTSNLLTGRHTKHSAQNVSQIPNQHSPIGIISETTRFTKGWPKKSQDKTALKWVKNRANWLTRFKKGGQSTAVAPFLGQPIYQRLH